MKMRACHEDEEGLAGEGVTLYRVVRSDCSKEDCAKLSRVEVVVLFHIYYYTQ